MTKFNHGIEKIRPVEDFMGPRTDLDLFKEAMSLMKTTELYDAENIIFAKTLDMAVKKLLEYHAEKEVITKGAQDRHAAYTAGLWRQYWVKMKMFTGLPFDNILYKNAVQDLAKLAYQTDVPDFDQVTTIIEYIVYLQANNSRKEGPFSPSRWK